MAGATSKTPSNCRISEDNTKFSGNPESAADMIFGFLEDNECTSESSSNSGESYISEEEDENSSNDDENKVFWESQEQLLKATLCRTSSIESKIRQATKEALRELNTGEFACGCQKRVGEGCRKCTQRQISDHLQNAGYNCSICKSKWMNLKEVPAGEHTYLEVMDNSSSKKGEVRVIIELNFRAEFEMLRASEEYTRLTNRLPEVFVGKSERLRALIKILCSAFKKCMRERKMHIAPWRKHKYMEAKWLGNREPRTPVAIWPVVERFEQPTRQRQMVSLLTFDLKENLCGLQPMAIKVL